MMKISEIISIDNSVLSGQAVFKGSRVPIESLFMHLEKGISLNDFLDDFPTGSREQAVSLLVVAGKIVNAKNLNQLYEAAA